VIELRMRAALNQTEGLPQDVSDTLVQTIGSRSEKWYEKLEDKVNLKVQTLKPEAFLKGALNFLTSVGLVGPTLYTVDKKAITPQAAQGPPDLAQAIESLIMAIDRTSSVDEIEIASAGRNYQFEIWLNLFYWRKHSPHNPTIELLVRAMSNELGPNAGESFASYKARMKTLDMDHNLSSRTFADIEEHRKVMYSDFSHHLAEAFPGITVSLYESSL